MRMEMGHQEDVMRIRNVIHDREALSQRDGFSLRYFFHKQRLFSHILFLSDLSYTSVCES